MSIAELETVVLRLGPDAAGMALSPAEFDAAEFEEGYRYELIGGVLVVSPATSPNERDPNGELEYWLRSYRDNHPQGSILDATLSEHDILVGDERRRADRVIWVGLGRDPEADEVPSIVVEFVSTGKRSFIRDYRQKRREYAAIGVQEYWVFNRFRRTLTVFREGGEPVFRENDVYTTPLLPGFTLPLAKLFKLASRWKPL